MKQLQKNLTKNLELIVQTINHLLPFASFTTLDKLKKQFVILTTTSDDQEQQKFINIIHQYMQTTKQSIQRVFANLKLQNKQKLQSDIRPIKPINIAQNKKHLLMKWRHVDDIMGQTVKKYNNPHANIHYEAVSLLAATIPRLQLSIDRIKQTKYNKTRYKSNTLRHSKIWKQQMSKSIDVTTYPFEDIYLKSSRLKKGNKSFKIDRLF